MLMFEPGLHYLMNEQTLKKWKKKTTATTTQVPIIFHGSEMILSL